MIGVGGVLRATGACLKVLSNLFALCAFGGLSGYPSVRRELTLALLLSLVLICFAAFTKCLEQGRVTSGCKENRFCSPRIRDKVE